MLSPLHLLIVRTLSLPSRADDTPTSEPDGDLLVGEGGVCDEDGEGDEAPDERQQRAHHAQRLLVEDEDVHGQTQARHQRAPQVPQPVRGEAGDSTRSLLHTY